MAQTFILVCYQSCHTTEEATVLLGAHTIGQIRVEFGDELAGPWVPGGKDDATEGGPIFNNEYHDFLVNKLDARSVSEFMPGLVPRDIAPFNEDFLNWFQVNQTEIKLDHLDSDVSRELSLLFLVHRFVECT